MKLIDERGEVLAEIRTDSVWQFTHDELEGRRAGDTFTTAQILEDLKYRGNTGNDFTVEWLEAAVNELKEILPRPDPIGSPLPNVRHQNALSKYYQKAVASIDLQLRAWATLASKSIVKTHILKDYGLEAQFTVDCSRQIVRVEYFGRHSAQIASPSEA
jgi:hypothetical protein